MYPICCLCGGDCKDCKQRKQKQLKCEGGRPTTQDEARRIPFKKGSRLVEFEGDQRQDIGYAYKRSLDAKVADHNVSTPDDAIEMEQGAVEQSFHPAEVTHLVIDIL